MTTDTKPERAGGQPARRGRRLPAAVLVLIVLATLVDLLGAVWPAAVTRLIPTGLAPVAALTALVLLAHRLHARLPALAGFVLPLVLVNAVLSAIEVPGHLGPAERTAAMDTALRVLWALFMLYLVGKVLLLRRFARRAYPAGDRVPDPMTPLPSQEKDLEKLAALVAPAGDEAGRVVPLRGRWGEGKSFLLRLLKERWDPDPGAPALVIVDVWQQETEADLQVSIIEAVLSHPSYLRDLRWCRIPVSFLFARPVAGLRDSVRSVQFRMLESRAGNLEAELQLPRVSWQGLFERLTQSGARCRTVIALDEADRATPTVTQAALTLARRSADSPRVTVLLPYIQPLIRYKAFNPLLPTLPDLASSMQAVLYEEAMAPGGLAAAGHGPDGDGSILDMIKRSNSGWRAAVKDMPGEQMRLEPTGAGEVLPWLLAATFASAGPERRQMLQARFEEKYLGPAGLRIAPPGADDLAAMLGILVRVRDIVEHKLLHEKPLSARTHEELGTAIRQGLERWHSRLATVPPLRILEGRLHEVFYAAGTPARPCDPRVVATLALAAYDVAALIHGATLEG
ncbi:P-loop NTPase fold protein [Sphaerisporangium aureirubrum]|uniref:P-loop NTPase fold protein n=1 Tax=Sphaerisporangium aureirubrum TaxID=1544736 RepID=A0ABW1NIS2_9ACTN